MRPITFLVAVLAVAPFTSVRGQHVVIEDPSAGLLALVGFGTGAALGSVVGFFGEGDEPQSPKSPCFDKSCVPLGAAIGGGAGALLGVGYWVIESSAASNPLKSFVAGGTGLGVGASFGAAIVLLSVSEGRVCPNADCVGQGAALGGFVGAVLGTVYGTTRGRRGGRPGPVQHVLVGLGVGSGVGGFWGFMTDDVSPISRISSTTGGAFSPTTGDPCFARSCTLLGAAIGGGYGTLVGLTYWAVVTDREPNAFLGGVAGLVVGSAIGFALGVRLEAQAALAEARGDELKHICADVNCVRLGTVIIGGIGTVLGSVVSGVHGSSKQPDAGSDRLRLTIGPHRDGRLALGLSVRF